MSDDKSIIIWDINKSYPIQIINQHQDKIMNIIKLRDKKLATSSYDKTIIIWNKTNENYEFFKILKVKN